LYHPLLDEINVRYSLLRTT